MSNAVFPALNSGGIAFPIPRTVIWKTSAQENVSGKEFRIAEMTYPRYQWDIPISVLRSTGTQDFQTLMGFYNARQGSFDSFLYTDPDDNSVTGQALGVGDGSTLAFQLVRGLGGFVEPVLAPNVVSHVYVNGVDQVGFWTASGWGTSTPGVITFSGGHAPAVNAAVTADFTYYWPCRFVDDKLAFNLFMSTYYEVKKLSFVSVKN